jgi:hypothetical protein
MIGVAHRPGRPASRPGRIRSIATGEEAGA